MDTRSYRNSRMSATDINRFYARQQANTAAREHGTQQSMTWLCSDGSLVHICLDGTIKTDQLPRDKA